MVDALASGASVLRDVEVQVLSRVPNISTMRKYGVFALLYLGHVISRWRSATRW